MPTHKVFLAKPFSLGEPHLVFYRCGFIRWNSKNREIWDFQSKKPENPMPTTVCYNSFPSSCFSRVFQECLMLLNLSTSLWSRKYLFTNWVLSVWDSNLLKATDLVHNQAGIFPIPGFLKLFLCSSLKHTHSCNECGKVCSGAQTLKKILDHEKSLSGPMKPFLSLEKLLFWDDIPESLSHIAIGWALWEMKLKL